MEEITALTRTLNLLASIRHEDDPTIDELLAAVPDLQAFNELKPNRELRPLYEAAVARQQADQIFNLSLTRTATRTLLARGVSGVIGIGRVKTPTLAIVCLREIEIRDFRIEDYFEIVATAKIENGTFLMRHAPPAKARIRDRAVAEAIARAAAGHTGPLTVSVEHRRQAPPAGRVGHGQASV